MITNSGRRRLIAVGSILLLTTLSGRPLALPQKEPAMGERPAVKLRALVSTRDGPISSRAEVTFGLEPGRPSVGYVSAGDLEGDRSLCLLGVGGGLRRAWPRHYWRVEFSLVKWDAGELEFRVDWKRFRSSGDPPRHERIAGDSRILKLPEGGRHLLDFVRADPADSSSDCNTPSLLIELEAGFEEDLTLARELVRYDVWLVHRNSDGLEQRRHYEALVRQGESLPFWFQPIRIPLSSSAGIQEKLEVVLDISGDLRGRLRRDGTVHLVVNTERQSGLAPAGQPSRGFSGGGGRKELLVSHGEAIRIVLPEATGGSRIPLAGASARPPDFRGASEHEAVSIREGWMQLSHAKFLEGHETSLIITAKREP